MLLGLAIGDSLGASTEGMIPQLRRKKYGEIHNYMHKRGNPTDDTQLTFWTVEQILEDDCFIPDNLARRFCRDHINGIGSTVKEFIRNYKDKNKLWYESGPESAGNGSLMRITPMIIPHVNNPSQDIWVDTALSCMITHNDYSAISSCLAFNLILFELLKMNDAPEPKWWLDTYTTWTKNLEKTKLYQPRFGALKGKYTLNEFTGEWCNKVYEKNLSVLDACNIWGSGAYLLETVPSVIYILMKYGHDAEEAIIRAVNDTKDNDTIGAIVGSAVGALHGSKSFPRQWVSQLSGRTRKNDDGRVFELIDAVKKRYWK